MAAVLPPLTPTHPQVQRYLTDPVVAPPRGVQCSAAACSVLLQNWQEVVKQRLAGLCFSFGGSERESEECPPLPDPSGTALHTTCLGVEGVSKGRGRPGVCVCVPTESFQCCVLLFCSILFSMWR
eukprot:TRINITY_DN15640_c0_g2_i1.p3 TRINITY_DN15640_c0_g2~~TRINITY_DN15640_c0_g2_i1.p3  ORF type:complete len:125 (+),score=13.75 TRINITY_DN15640_c0_g2_i1:61-435(+)